MHDDPYAAAFIVKTVLEASGLVHGYSYWTFSDIFEENYFPSTPFEGGFGLLDIHGIAKPAYRAFQLLHERGTQMMPVEGSRATVDAWFVRGDQRSTLVLTNFALPRHPIDTGQVSFVLKSAKPAMKASIQRIDLDHANAKRHWEQLGKPEYLSASTVGQLKELSQLQSKPVPVEHETGNFDIECRYRHNRSPQYISRIKRDGQSRAAFRRGVDSPAAAGGFFLSDALRAMHPTRPATRASITTFSTYRRASASGNPNSR